MATAVEWQSLTGLSLCHEFGTGNALPEWDWSSDICEDVEAVVYDDLGSISSDSEQFIEDLRLQSLVDNLDSKQERIFSGSCDSDDEPALSNWIPVKIQPVSGVQPEAACKHKSRASAVKAQEQKHLAILPSISSASISSEAQHWIANAFYSGNHRESMPPAFAAQLLRDPSFQPGPRPRQFDGAASCWVFKETVDTVEEVKRNRLNSKSDKHGPADRWHSSGGKKSSRYLPAAVPVIRRQYGAVEQSKTARFTYHEYSLLETNGDAVCSADSQEILPLGMDKTFVLFHVLQRRALVLTHCVTVLGGQWKPNKASTLTDEDATTPPSQEGGQTCMTVSKRHAGADKRQRDSEPEFLLMRQEQLRRVIQVDEPDFKISCITSAPCDFDDGADDHTQSGSTKRDPANTKQESQHTPSVISTASISAAERWIADTHYSGNHRESMPPAFAAQLLRDPSFQPGPRPRQFDPATAKMWVFKESVDTVEEVKCNRLKSDKKNQLMPADRWHSSGGKKSSRDLPSAAPVIRRRYGAIERKTKAVFAFNAYSSLVDSDSNEDKGVVLYHVVERRSASKNKVTNR
jgi:hypothetical protein